MQQKGIVLQSKKDEYTLVVTRQNDWIELPYREGVEVGEEITFTVPVKKYWWKSRKAMSFLSAATAACLTSVLLFSPWLASDTHASTYISVESQNSHIEVGISTEKRVVNLQANSSSQKVIRQMHDDWKGKKLDTFVLDYLQTAKEQGVLKSKDKVIVAEKNISSIYTKSIQQLQQEIKKIPALKQMELYVLPLPPKVYQLAKKEGMPPAKYVILIVARKEKVPISLIDEEIVNMNQVLETDSVKRILEQPPQSEEEWMSLLNEPSPEDEPIVQTDEKMDSSNISQTSSTTADSSSGKSKDSTSSANSSASDLGTTATSDENDDDESKEESKPDKESKSGEEEPPSPQTGDNTQQEQQKKEEPKQKPNQEPSDKPSDQPSNEPNNNENNGPAEKSPEPDPSQQPEPPKEEPAPTQPEPPKEEPAPEQPEPPQEIPADPVPVIEPLPLITVFLFKK